MQPGSPQSESSEARPSRSGRARQRHLARQARQVAPPVAYSGSRPARRYSSAEPSILDRLRDGSARVQAAIVGGEWRLSGRQFALIGIGLAALIVLFSALSIGASGNILPRVSVGGIDVGGLDKEAAEVALREAWMARTLQLRQGDRTWTVNAYDMGFRIDTEMSIQAALRYGRDGGLPAILGTLIAGGDIRPVVDLDMGRARQKMLEIAQLVQLPAQNATVRLQGVVVTAIGPRDGWRLNVAELLPWLAVDPAGVIAQGVIELPMLPVKPLILDASALVDYAQALLQWPLTLEAYDPVTDQTYPFVVPPDQWGQWLDTRLVRHETGPRLYLSISAPAIRRYLYEQSDRLPDPMRLDVQEGIEAVQDAVANGTLSTWVTVRYDPTIHEIERGETAYSIARTTGIPFYLIEQANPDRDLSVLYPGDRINLPSRDILLPLRPVMNKRIVVDLSEQYMWAYENGQVRFEWAISSGLDSAPTSTGVFQILSHAERAYGSSYTLCDDEADSCGQWVMHWFMGVYEAVPGLMNGFHGAVELPNGTYLGGGNVGRPYTFGCIMALEENAIQLYNWAEQGVVVEIRP